MAKYLKHTDICIGARVAILPVNFLPEAGLYNGVIGNVVEIVYQDRQIEPNDKQHYHLPDYVVVDFQHLKLPSNMAPWDKLHKAVSRQNIHNLSKMCQLILTQTISMYLSQWKPNSGKNMLFSDILPIDTSMGYNNTQISGFWSRVWRERPVSAFNHRSRWYQVQATTTRTTLHCYKMCKDNWRHDTRCAPSKN